jgi:hypothetical protein
MSRRELGKCGILLQAATDLRWSARLTLHRHGDSLGEGAKMLTAPGAVFEQRMREASNHG